MAGAELPVFGPGQDVLLVDGTPVAALAVARTAAERRKGLLKTSAVEGALWITKCPSVHMVGMRYPIDVAVLDRDGVVLHVATLRPTWGMTRIRLRARDTVETGAGRLAEWGVRVGCRLKIAPG
ncbi:DUF192 domain-containing protein [Angustibacter sp. McL0619]|uniref:DUF192 domain-containing protein n=1 Tax=Angustibacter sp. McL0619 TaxID=3415676 RepID=UPI003CF69C11